MYISMGGRHTATLGFDYESFTTRAVLVNLGFSPQSAAPGTPSLLNAPRSVGKEEIF